MSGVPYIVEISLLLLIVFLIGCVIGFLLRNYLVKAPNWPQAEAKKSDPSPASADVVPLMLSQPRDGGKDNLKRISGIGPGIEKKLNTLGVFHIDQIAGWDDRAIAWVDAQLTSRGRIAREKWVEQAREILKNEN